MFLCRRWVVDWWKKVVSQSEFQEHSVEQTVDIPVFGGVEEFVRSSSVSSRDRVQPRIQENIDNFPETAMSAKVTENASSSTRPKSLKVTQNMGAGIPVDVMSSWRRRAYVAGEMVENELPSGPASTSSEVVACEDKLGDAEWEAVSCWRTV